MKNQNGITLIALVITIIVLLILAGVSIAMLTGDNGLLTRADESKKVTAEAEAIEKINLTLNAIKVEAYANKVDNKAWLAVSGETPALDAGVEKVIEDDGFVAEAETGYAYEFDKDEITLTFTDADLEIEVSGTFTVADNSIDKAE